MRRRIERHTLQREQQTEWFYRNETPAFAGQLAIDTAMDSHMLIEDVHNGILPIGNSDEDKWNVTLQPGNTAVEELLIGALDREGHAHDLQEALQEFVPDCAQNLMRYGECAYEIVRLVLPETDDVKRFDFMPIPAGSLRHQRGQWTQHLPSTVAIERKKPRVIPIEPERLILFSLPPILGTKKQHFQMLQNMVVLSKNIMPSFGMACLLGSSSVPYDQTLFFKTRALATAEATKQIGYDQRSLFHEYCGDYYWFFRILKFHRFKIILRNSILSQLNNALPQIGTEFGPVGSIAIEGLPTIEDVEEAEKAMREGTRSLTEIMKPFR